MRSLDSCVVCLEGFIAGELTLGGRVHIVCPTGAELERRHRFGPGAAAARVAAGTAAARSLSGCLYERGDCDGHDCPFPCPWQAARGKQAQLA